METIKIVNPRPCDFSVGDWVSIDGKPFFVTHVNEKELVVQRKETNGLYTVRKIEFWNAEISDFIPDEKFYIENGFVPQEERGKIDPYRTYLRGRFDGRSLYVTESELTGILYWSVRGGEAESIKEIRSVRQLQHLLSLDNYRINIKVS